MSFRVRQEHNWGVLVGCMAALLGGCTGSVDEESAPMDELVTVHQGLTFNNDPRYLYLVNMNMGMFGDREGGVPSPQANGFHWKDLPRCLADATCNGFNVVPDVLNLQEVSGTQCEAMDNELERVLNSGTNAWDYVYLNDYRTSSGHWMSNCILYRRARFDSATRQIKYIAQQTGNGAGCATTDSTRMLNFAAPDLVRKNAGLTGWLSLVDRHEDHFGPDIPGSYDTCDDSTFQADGYHVQDWDTTQFCVYPNTRSAEAEMAVASLMIQAGDFNYNGKKCNGNSYYRCHYKAMVTGLGDCAGYTFTWPNLGWYDPVAALDTNVFTDSKSDIDGILVKNHTGAALMPPTTRNYTKARIAKGFYSTATDAYWPAEGEVNRISDHDGLFVRLEY